jgi:hypothetical protein
LTEVDDPLYMGVPQNTDVPVDIDRESRRVWYMGADEVIPVITITQQPVDTTRGCLGSSTTLSIRATATFNARLSYQWLRNGSPIPEGFDGRFFGTQTPTLTILNTKPTDEGTYACLVTGNSGATPVLSNLSQLIVWAPIEITKQPESQFACLGGEVILGVLANGTIFGYQWQKETPSGWQDIPGATQGQLRLSNLDYNASGRYRCVLFGTCGTDRLPTEPATIFVLGDARFTSPPDTVLVGLGGEAVLEAEAEVIGAPPTYQGQYQWYRGTVALQDGGRISGARSSRLVIRGVEAGDIGSDYWVEVSGLCGRAEQHGYAILSPRVEVVQQPQGGQFCAGSAVVLTVQAQAGGGAQRVEYQWRRDGQPLADGGNISGARTGQLRLDPVGVGDGGTYDVVVTAQPGGVQAVSQPVVVEVVEPVTIVGQPQGGQLCEGQPVVLEVQAGGGGVRYQWYKDGQPLVGATGARYEVAAAQASDAGQYWCEVWNECDTVRSGQAVVSVVVGVAEGRGGEVLEVVPQPVLGGVMEIRLRLEGHGVVVVREVTGREVWRGEVYGGGLVRVEGLSSGVYLVQLEQAGRVVGQQPVVVVR